MLSKGVDILNFLEWYKVEVLNEYGTTISFSVNQLVKDLGDRIEFRPARMMSDLLYHYGEQAYYNIQSEPPNYSMPPVECFPKSMYLAPLYLSTGLELIGHYLWLSANYFHRHVWYGFEWRGSTRFNKNWSYTYYIPENLETLNPTPLAEYKDGVMFVSNAMPRHLVKTGAILDYEEEALVAWLRHSNSDTKWNHEKGRRRTATDIALCQSVSYLKERRLI